MTPPPKICTLCARDCSAIPRVKDAHGNYICKDCEQARAASKLTPRSPGPSDGVAIEPDRPTSRGVCPSCFRPLPPDTGVCVSCATGLNRKPSPDGSGPTCQKCGYDLTGARSLICPECGTTQRPQSRKNLDMSRQVIRDAYVKPVLTLIIGLMLIVAFQFAIGRQEAIPQVLIAVVVQSLVGLVIFWICSLIWIGFDEPFHINVLRLLAIYAISWAALLVAASLPPLLCSAIIFVPAGIFVLLHKKMLDLDLADAALVAVFTGIVWVAVFVVILGQTYL